MNTSPMFTVAGMVHEQQPITVGDLVDRAIVDDDGRVLISLIDVLAAVRVGVDADLLVIEFVDGDKRAVRLAPVIEADDTWVRLSAIRRHRSDAVEWTARLWSARCGSSPALVSISATTFAAFVGLQ
jgi:hypothetical protein